MTTRLLTNLGRLVVLICAVVLLVLALGDWGTRTTAIIIAIILLAVVVLDIGAAILERDSTRGDPGH